MSEVDLKPRIFSRGSSDTGSLSSDSPTPSEAEDIKKKAILRQRTINYLAK